jgi:hypothetical protein
MSTKITITPIGTSVKNSKSLIDFQEQVSRSQAIEGGSCGGALRCVEKFFYLQTRHNLDFILTKIDLLHRTVMSFQCNNNITCLDVFNVECRVGGFWCDHYFVWIKDE